MNVKYFYEDMKNKNDFEFLKDYKEFEKLKDPDYSLDEAFSMYLIKEFKVAAIPCYPFFKE